MTPRWAGETSAAAAQRLALLREGIEDDVAEVSALRQAMGETADAVSGLAHAVSEIDYLAEAHQFRIFDDNTVWDNGGPDPARGEEGRRDRAQMKAELTDRVEQVVRRAEDIDSDLCHVLNKILDGQVNAAGDGGLTAAASAGADAGHLSMIEPPRGGTPADNAGWYASLGPGEKAWILTNRPDLIGNLDGVPPADRDKANRARIPGERARFEAERDRAQASGDTVEYDRAMARLKSLDNIEKMLANGDRHLLVLDTSGERARAAVAIGDVSTANHVAVFTPGMNSSVEGNMPGYDNDMNELRERTEDELDRAGRPNETVAVVTWLNYEPPTTDSIVDAAGSLSDDRATDGANRLASFMEGVNASSRTDPHLTALGHSYGSLTTGIALRDHPNTGVDEAVFFGSPGLGVDRASDLHIPQGHGYNMAALDDPVTHVGLTEHHGMAPYGMQDMNQMSTQDYTAPDGRNFDASSGHSEYLRGGDNYTTSEWNMATIIGGTGTGARL
ncbi:alpha/beta hydrolase [Alloactinosynnema sp. L-07]|uniref:alpha/beta hydrolase n=1 Tax=Alloactinosynnema sp. L-07 TaxID=1653480 RepID=UPI00155FB34F|nr:alpha/beta hydrolase [Alloactinosynnema sp. L-07]